jgi:(2Fe-2S) ferredoxin
VGTGILGKWKYIPNLDAFLGLQDAVAGNVWIYKPIGWVNPAPSNHPPTVALVAPVAGSAYTAPARVDLAAIATDTDGTIAKVEFFDGASKIGEALAAPFSMSWTGVAAGSYSLTARATDNVGAMTTSTPPVAITVSAVPAQLQFALYRTATNRFFVDYDFDQVPDLKKPFGAPGDSALAGRINNDALADFVVYRSGIWYVDTDRNGVADLVANFGGVSGDIPLLADFDSDGRDDLVIYRNGRWYVSTAQDPDAYLNYVFGCVPGDIPLAGDINGDGIADLIIYRSGFWYIDTHRDGIADAAILFGGGSEDIPLLFDWDGDGRADLCIFRDGVWYVNTQQDGTLQVLFGYGTGGDVPLTGRFN